MEVTDVRAKRIRNSRREWTIEVLVRAGKHIGVGKAPSGASKGEHEVIAFPKGVDYSVKLVNSKVKKLLLGVKFEKFEDLKKIERKLKAVKNLGGNPIIALEFALLNCLAKEKGKPLWKVLNPRARKIPMPLANVVGGGAHTKKKGALDVQEILLLPQVKKFEKAVKVNREIYQEIAKKLKKVDKKFKREKTDEHAWITYLSEPHAFEAVREVVDAYCKKKKVEVKIGVDFAASWLWKEKRYIWSRLDSGIYAFGPQGEMDLIQSLAERFDFYYLEDPLLEDDFKGFRELRDRMPNRLICGDDLTVTNPERIKKAIRMGSINAVIIKPNQVGSLIRTKEAIDIAKKNKIIIVMSHRSGETDDATIAHLAFAWGADIVKFGVAGEERLAKLNELIKIERSLLQ